MLYRYPTAHDYMPAVRLQWRQALAVVRADGYFDLVLEGGEGVRG